MVTDLDKDPIPLEPENIDGVNRNKTGKYTLRYTYKTENGEQLFQQIVNFEVKDTTAPTIVEVTPSITKPTNGSVTLNVSADDENGVVAYSFNNGEWQEENTATFDSNQTVIVKVKDEAGNVSEEVSYKIENIDKTAPKVTTNIFRVKNKNTNARKYATIGDKIYVKLYFDEELSEYPVVKIAGFTIDKYKEEQESTGKKYYTYDFVISEEVAARLIQNEKIPFEYSAFKDVAGNETNGKSHTVAINGDYIIFDNIVSISSIVFLIIILKMI